MMFLANENFPRPSIELLRNEGYIVKSIQEDCPGISDLEVITVAAKNNFIILTFDKDYGEIVFRIGSDIKPAIVFFRHKGADPLLAGKLLLRILIEAKISLRNAFSVVEHSAIRQRIY